MTNSAPPLHPTPPLPIRLVSTNIDHHWTWIRCFSVPGITIATDIICGFPTETDEDFEATVDLVHEYQFPSLFINQFYPRPGTPAAKLKRIDTVEVKRRTKALAELFHSYFPYEGRVSQMYIFCIVSLCIVSFVFSVLFHSYFSYEGRVNKMYFLYCFIRISILFHSVLFH